MVDKLEALGVSVDLPLVEPILSQVKNDMRRLRRVLTDDEVRKIAANAKTRAGVQGAAGGA